MPILSLLAELAPAMLIAAIGTWFRTRRATWTWLGTINLFLAILIGILVVQWLVIGYIPGRPLQPRSWLNVA